MTRKTSSETYAAIKQRGLLTGMRWQVYNLLYGFGPLTGSEVDNRLVEAGKRPHFHKRLSELEALGAVERVGQRTCQVTGRNAELWDVTDTLPSTAAAVPAPAKAVTVRPAPIAAPPVPAPSGPRAPRRI